MTDHIEVLREAVKNAGLESLVPLIDALEAELAQVREAFKNYQCWKCHAGLLDWDEANKEQKDDENDPAYD